MWKNVIVVILSAILGCSIFITGCAKHHSDGDSTDTQIQLTKNNLNFKVGSAREFYDDGIKTEGSKTIAIYDKNMSSATLETTVSLDVDEQAGIIFGQKESGYYYFCLYDYRQVKFMRVTGEKEYLVFATNIVTIAARNYVKLKVVVDGNSCKGYVNDVCYLNRTEKSSLDGALGLRADTEGVPFRSTTLTNELKYEKADIVLFGHSHVQCWEHLEQDLASAGKAVNAGLGGSIISQWMPRVDELTAYGAKKYVCWLGSNDIGAGIQNDVCVDRLNAMFEQIAKAVPDAEIYLFTEFYQLESSRANETFKAKIRDLNSKYKNEFYGINIVDIFDVVLDDDGKVDDSLFRDVYHLKADKYGKVTEKLLNAMQNPVKVNENTGVNAVTGSKTGDYIVSEGTNSAWTIQENNGLVSLVSNEQTQLITFANREFNGGTVEFYIRIPDSSFSSHNVSGVVIGANHNYVRHGAGLYYCVGQSKWGDLVCFSKNHTAFTWEHENKVPQGSLSIGTEYKIKVVWDKENNALHYFINDIYRASTTCSVALDGNKIGFYADSAGVQFRDIRISDELELDGVDYFFSKGTNTAWSISGTEKKVVYEATAGNMLTFNKQFDNANKWLIEYDLTATGSNYANNLVSGLIIGASSPVIDSKDTFVAVGRCAYNGEFNAYSCVNGKIRWEDDNKVVGAFNETGVKYHIKFIWDKELGTITYYNGNNVIGVNQLSMTLKGNYFGLVSDSSTKFENISITAV